jgi:hypothetical protein
MKPSKTFLLTSKDATRFNALLEDFRQRGWGVVPNSFTIKTIAPDWWSCTGQVVYSCLMEKVTLP